MVNTGAATGQVYINTITGFASGMSPIMATGMITVFNATVVPYIPGGATYEPVPLPTPPEPEYRPIVNVVERVQQIIAKKKILTIRETPIEYIPYYTQPIEGIKKYVLSTPETGIKTIIRQIISYLTDL